MIPQSMIQYSYKACLCENFYFLQTLHSPCCLRRDMKCIGNTLMYSTAPWRTWWICLNHWNIQPRYRPVCFVLLGHPFFLPMIPQSLLSRQVTATRRRPVSSPGAGWAAPDPRWSSWWLRGNRRPLMSAAPPSLFSPRCEEQPPFALWSVHVSVLPLRPYILACCLWSGAFCGHGRRPGRVLWGREVGRMEAAISLASPPRFVLIAYVPAYW